MLKRFGNTLFHWELWHFNAIYAPLGLIWAYCIAKAGAIWFFSNVNPTLEFGGFEGEAKRQMYEQLPKNLYPATVYVSPADTKKFIREKMEQAGITYPLIVKPDVGTQGLMFRRLATEEELWRYHHFLGADYLIQTFVDLPEEYSLFYIRYPGKKTGKITGLILKDYLAVTGDGRSDLACLIQQNNRSKHRWVELKKKHHAHLSDIIPEGQKYLLSIAGNHNRGARFVNLHNEIDDQLRATMDAISEAVPQFYYGRYDLKCASLADLKAGKNIQILEFNGTGAEPNHIYDCGMTYFDAMKVIVNHWRDMYRIGRINYKNGIPYWSFKRGRNHMKKTNRWYEKLRKADIAFDW